MADLVGQIPFPTKLELRKGNLSENWKKFDRIWANYEIATGLTEKDPKLRVATLLTCLGPDAIELFETFPLSDPDKNDPAKVRESFQKYCIGETNETYERFNFNSRTQETGESIDAYVSSLRNLVKTCNYGELASSLLRDRLVMGIRDSGTRMKLLQEKNLDLSKCIDICRASEKTAEQMKTLNHEDVAFVTKTKNPHVQKRTRKERECWYCGKSYEPKKEACPAWGKKCSKCGAENHFAKKCRNEGTRPNQKKKKSGFKVRPKRGKHGVNVVQDFPSDTSDSEDYDILSIEEIGSVDLPNSQYSKKLFARMVIGDQLMKCQLDSGATVNILSDTDYMSICDDPWLEKLHECDITLRMYNQTETKALGKRNLKVTNPKNRKTYKIDFVIVKGPARVLLGAQAIQRMKLITVNREQILSVETPETLINEYEDVFHGEGKLPGVLHLEVEENAKPVKQPVRKVPVAVKPKLKKELQRLEKLKIIEQVQDPTDWISSMVVVMKSTDKVRLCIDPKPLNKCLKRNNYPIPTIEDILPELTKARVFSLVDAKDWFWHVELDTESSYLTTIGTPWGRYRWLRMPFGISPAPEEFQRRIDEALEGLDGIKAIHDDILVWGSGENDEEALEDHDKKMKELFERCRSKNIKLNKEKLKFRKKAVVFMGHVISAQGLRPDENKLKAVQEMQIPTDKKGVQRLLGMVNYVQKFAPQLSTVTEPLRQLIRKDTEFVWDKVHDKSLKEIQTILSSPPVLKFFDVDKETVLQCDASETGLGACLMQEGHPIAYASRALTVSEKNYAQIEKELLAIVFGMEKFEHYLYGRKVLVESDHKPLEIIFKKTLVSAPKRLQRMLLRLQKFDIEVQYKPGTQMYMADTLSRAYLPVSGDEERTYTENEVESINMIEMLPVSQNTVVKIKSETARDPTLQSLSSVVMKGWPEDRQSLPEYLHSYFPFREEISIQDGILFKGERVVIPNTLKGLIIERVHSSHIGIQGCLRRAREAVYWPNMSSDIEQYIQLCDTCNSLTTKQQKETLICHEVPTRPWEVIGIDLFGHDGKDYLITVDYMSSYFEVDRLYTKSAKGVIPALKKHMARYGIPEKVVSDNGPPFSGQDFRNFANTYEFKHVTSSPGYPQSNGKVENAVKTAKTLMKKANHSNTDAHLALLDFRNTPSEATGLSPAQVMFGRRTRTLLPVSRKLLNSNNTSQEAYKKRLKQSKTKQSYYYNKTAKDLAALKQGEVVRMSPSGRHKPWRKAIIEGEDGIRSYRLRTEDGATYRRNRRHIRSTGESFEDCVPDVLPSYVSENDQCKISKNVHLNQNSVCEKVENEQSMSKKCQSVKNPDVCSKKQSNSGSRVSSNTPQKSGLESLSFRTSSGRLVKKPKYLQEFET